MHHHYTDAIVHDPTLTTPDAARALSRHDMLWRYRP